MSHIAYHKTNYAIGLKVMLYTLLYYYIMCFHSFSFKHIQVHFRCHKFSFISINFFFQNFCVAFLKLASKQQQQQHIIIISISKTYIFNFKGQKI